MYLCTYKTFHLFKFHEIVKFLIVENNEKKNETILLNHIL